MTKESCSAGAYEYMYSHSQKSSGSIFSRTNSNINIYMGCERKSSKATKSTSLGTSIVRRQSVSQLCSYSCRNKAECQRLVTTLFFIAGTV